MLQLLKSKTKSNLPPQLRRARKKLESREDIIIKPQTNQGGLAILKKTKSMKEKRCYNWKIKNFFREVNQNDKK